MAALSSLPASEYVMNVRAAEIVGSAVVIALFSDRKITMLRSNLERASEYSNRRR